MSKLDTVLEFYTRQFNDLGLPVGENGLVSYKRKDDLKPLTVSGHRMCFPTHALLREAEWDNRIVFHPLAEQYSTELSPILNALKSYIVVSLTTKLSLLAMQLAELGADASRQKGLGKEAGSILKEIGPIDEAVVRHVKAILKLIGDAPERRLVNILMKNSNGGAHLRNCIITFPLVEQIETAFDKGESSVLGVNIIDPKDKPTILKLFKYITGDKVITGSNDRTAPYYDCLLLGWLHMAEHFNAQHKLWKSKIPVLKTEVLAYELEWRDIMDAGFSAFAENHHAVAPPLPGTRPVADVETEEVVETTRRQSERVYETDRVHVGGARSLEDFGTPRRTERPRERERDVPERVSRERPARSLTLDSFGSGGRSSRRDDEPRRRDSRPSRSGRDW